jgi:4-hydroxyphenylacetate 3-monooxygenase
MPARNGQQYLNGLRDGREVWIEGERVADVTEHPALCNGAHSVARLYDLQHDPHWAEALTYYSPSSGEPVGLSFLTPRSADDLIRRRRMMEVWAAATGGMMGRTPDYVNVIVMACAAARDFLEENHAGHGANMVAYYEHCRERDLCLTHTLITPQVNRAVGPSGQVDPYIALGIVDKTSEGMLVRGARMLATLSPFADEIIVFPSTIVSTGQEEWRYAFAFALPIATPGLKFICRESFDLGRSHFDHPLGSRFEEMDAMAIFEDVLVPWERVFLCGDVERCNAWMKATGSLYHMINQVAVKNIAKTEFLLGVATLMVEGIGAEGFLHVQEKLAEVVDDLEILRGLLRAAEIDAIPGPGGAWHPAPEPLNTIRSFYPKAYPRMVEILQLLGASGLMAIPTEEDLRGPTGEAIERYYQGRKLPAEERIQLFRLGWDIACSAFAGRQVLYERFFFGDPVRVNASRYLGYDKDPARGAVRRFLAEGVALPAG